MSKHTPGPWAVFKQSEQEVLSIITASIERPRWIAHIEFASGLDAEDEANARLIAAAPEMLTVIQRVLGTLPQGEKWPVYMSDAIIEARALLARVQGE